MILLALAGVADADKLVTKYLRSENIHIADRKGAMNRYYAVTITLDLSANGKAKAIDAGTDRDHHLYENNSNSETKVVWTNKWSGTWKKSGATVEVSLKLDDRTCTKTKTYDHYKPSTEPCRTVTKQLVLACTTTKVDVEKPTGPGVTPTPAWRCDPVGTVELAETPNSWLFGTAGCIQISDGRHGSSYRSCATP